MLFAVLCTDKPDSLRLRMDTRPVHVEFLTDLNARGILKMGGPFLDSEGQPNGSLLILEAETQEAAAGIAAGDPYARAGLFAHVEIKAYRWVFNAPQA